VETHAKAGLFSVLQGEIHHFIGHTSITPLDELGVHQTRPSIAVDAAGNAYAVWSDWRNGNGDIYFAYRPQGATWGPGVRVNDDSSGARQQYPVIAVDGDGNAFAVWSDRRNSNADIYFAYRPAGGGWGANVKVNDDPGTASQTFPDIAVDAAGNAYAIWRDSRNSNDNIYFAYRPAGGGWGPNVMVNDDTGSANQLQPAIAVDGSGNAFAVWTDWRGGSDDYNIYSAYRPVGGSWGSNQRVNDDQGTAWQAEPDVAVDSTGNAYAIWEDYRNDTADIYFSYRPIGSGWGMNTQVNAVADASYLPAIAVDGSGTAYAVWGDFRTGIAEINFASRPDGGEWGNPTLVDDVPGYDEWFSLALAVRANGDAFVAWENEYNYNRDIYFAYCSSDGIWDDSVRLSDHLGVITQFDPAIAVSPGGKAYAVWEDGRNQDLDIYVAERPAGGAWGASFKVSDDPGSAEQSNPAIALADEENQYAVWEDRRNGNADIYFSHREGGGAWSANLKINDDLGTADQTNPDIAVDSIGNAYIIWQDYRNGDADIYFAYCPSAGGCNPNVRVNQDNNGDDQAMPAIAVDGNGKAYAIWQDNYSSDVSFALRPMDGDWGDHIHVSDSTSGWASKPDIGVDVAGNAYAVWENYEDGDESIAFSYRPEGGDWGEIVAVNDIPGDFMSSDPSIAVDAVGNAYAAWEDVRDDGVTFSLQNIYFAHRPVGGAWGENVRVNKPPNTDLLTKADIGVDSKGNAYVVWEDWSVASAAIFFAHTDGYGVYVPLLKR
jgi:hypothetical protein